MGDSRPPIRSTSRRYSNTSAGGAGGFKSPRQSSASVRGTREKMVEVDEDGRGSRRWERRDDPRR